MTTLVLKKDLQNKVTNKSNNELLSIYENPQSKLNAGSDLEDGMIINDVVIQEMEKRLKDKGFFIGGLNDNQIAYYFGTQF